MSADPRAPSVPGAERVAVLRALMLGDLLCATPALRALRAGLPDARITLVGLPWAAELAARLTSVDDFIALPGWPGLPEAPQPHAACLADFLGRVRRARFDFALQLHGSGRVTNALLACFGARRQAGFVEPGGTPPTGEEAGFIDWPREGSEVERLLRLTDHLGFERRGTQLDFPLDDADRDTARRLLDPLRGRPYAVLHPGARLESRRWPAERFVAVGRALAARGLAVVVSGTAPERELAAGIAAAIGSAGIAAAAGAAESPAALDLAGRTNLWTLGAVIEGATVVVANDTGVSHVAAALRRPSVVVASGSEVLRWRPEDLRLHRVLWHEVACRPCGHARCPVGHPCADSVHAEQVTRAAQRAIAGVA